MNKPQKPDHWSDQDVGSRWRELATELRALCRRMPPSLAQAEKSYATSDPIPLPPDWMKSIQLAVQAHRANRTAMYVPSWSNDLPFATSTWQPLPPEAVRSHWVYQHLEASLSARLAAVPKPTRTARRQHLARKSWPAIPNVQVYDVNPAPRLNIPATDATATAPAQWHIYSDGSDWHYEALAMTMDPGATSDELAVYDHQHWQRN